MSVLYWQVSVQLNWTTWPVQWCTWHFTRSQVFPLLVTHVTSYSNVKSKVPGAWQPSAQPFCSWVYRRMCVEVACFPNYEPVLDGTLFDTCVTVALYLILVNMTFKSEASNQVKMFPKRVRVHMQLHSAFFFYPSLHGVGLDVCAHNQASRKHQCHLISYEIFIGSWWRS